MSGRRQGRPELGLTAQRGKPSPPPFPCRLPDPPLLVPPPPPPVRPLGLAVALTLAKLADTTDADATDAVEDTLRRERATDVGTAVC